MRYVSAFYGLSIAPRRSRLQNPARARVLAGCAALLGVMRSFAAPSPELRSYLTALAVFDIVAIVVRLWWWHP
jgi:hypothetical protein